MAPGQSVWEMLSGLEMECRNFQISVHMLWSFQRNLYMYFSPCPRWETRILSASGYILEVWSWLKKNHEGAIKQTVRVKIHGFCLVFCVSYVKGESLNLKIKASSVSPRECVKYCHGPRIPFIALFVISKCELDTQIFF